VNGGATPAPAFADHFSARAGAYRTSRPGYPDALFAWLAELPARRDVAWDCGCGSGPIHAHWPAERAHVEAGYRTLPFPFAEIEAPAFAMRARWPFERLVGYIDSWSAMKGWRAALGRDPLSEVAAELATVWGPREGRREIRWPLSLRVGRIR
jgi:hypothetical protein